MLDISCSEMSTKSVGSVVAGSDKESRAMQPSDLGIINLHPSNSQHLQRIIRLTMAASLPETMRAVVVHSTSQPPTVEQVPVPKPFHGSAVVQVLRAGVISYIRDIYNGKRKYPFAMPLIAGTSAIGRVVAVGPDAVKLKAGDLVFVDCTIRARDSDDIFLSGISQGFGEGSAKLMRDVWRDSGEL
jgi:hypothetical protein